MGKINCSLHLDIHLAFGFHILVSWFSFDNLFWILNLELGTWNLFSCVLINILLFGCQLNVGSKLKYICFINIDVVMYDMQIASYDANLCFFYE